VKKNLQFLEVKKMMIEIYPYQFVAVNEYSALLSGTVGNTAEESLAKFKKEWHVAPEETSMMGVCIVQFIPKVVIGKATGWYKEPDTCNPQT
jgi:hypothetical protein